MPRAAQVPGSKESGGKEAPRHLLSRPGPPWEHGEGSVHHPLWTCLDVTDRGQTGCWELRSSSPGTTQSSPSLVSATNHVGGGPVSPLRRQTAQAEPPRSSASTARPVSTATPRGGGVGPSEKRSEGNRHLQLLGSCASAAAGLEVPLGTRSSGCFTSFVLNFRGDTNKIIQVSGAQSSVHCIVLTTPSREPFHHHLLPPETLHLSPHLAITTLLSVSTRVFFPLIFSFF